MRNLAGLVLLMFFICLADAQTIHKEDFPMFLGKASPADTIIGNDTLKILKFCQWKIDSLDSDGNRISFYDSSLVGNDWFLPDTNDRIDSGEYSSRQYRLPYNGFYIMEDVHGYGSGSSILTVWQWLLGDSLKFVCGVNGPFGGNLSGGDIKWIGRFPDSSILLYVQIAGGDECDWWGGNVFLRATNFCDFKPFYRAGWDGGHGRTDQYYLEFIGDPEYQIVETNIYFSEDSIIPPSDCPDYRLDSAVSKVLNLWQMAKEYFKIDTGGKL